LADAISTGWVALDTNVLLIPYSVGKQSVEGITDTYHKLAQAGRLIVPGQAAREFARVRQSKLSDLLKTVSDTKSRVSLPVLKEAPLWEASDEFRILTDAWIKARESINEYERSLGLLLELVRKFTSEDPVSRTYGEIFIDQVVVDPEFDEQAFRTEHARRQAEMLPPGYKDGGKAVNSAGDLQIWATLLHATANSGKDLIFVTEERKSDWWHQAAGAPLTPRYELVDEYRRSSGGGTLHLLTLAELLAELEVPTNVVSEVQIREALRPTIYDTTQGAMYLLDGQTLLIRGDSGYGAIRPTAQFATLEGSQYLQYLSWFTQNAADFSDLETMKPYQGSAREGDGPGDAVALAGPFEVPWSFSGTGSGWFYYREYNGGRSGRADYELATADSDPIDWNYLTRGTFTRGVGDVL
jgi:hypothetical protein